MANIPVIDYKHANPESCETHCENAGYAYFALEFGFMCQCGDFLPPLMTEAGAEMCKTVSHKDTIPNGYRFPPVFNDGP